MPAVFPLDFADAGTWPACTLDGDGTGFMEVATTDRVTIPGEDPFETAAGFGCHDCRLSP